MKKINPKLGRERIHTVACYNVVWNKFQNLKHQHHLSANEMLNVLVNSYKQNDQQKQKSILIKLDKIIKNKIKNI